LEKKKKKKPESKKPRDFGGTYFEFGIEVIERKVKAKGIDVDFMGENVGRQ
jgi:hypothetical protein